MLDRIAEGHFADCSTDEELYETFLRTLKEDGHISKRDAVSSFQYALSIHSAAPRIEAHYQYYDTSVQPSLVVAQDAACPVWVHFDGKQYCSPALDRAQQDVGDVQNPEGLAFDRILGSGAAQSVLYADITSPLFSQFHRTIVSTARDGDTTYRVRYRRESSETPREPLSVNGYGVELALKRTDYIVIDDRQSDAEAHEDNAALEEPLSVDKQPDDTVLDDMNEDILDLKPLTAKELSGLGWKSASFIMASNDPLETLVKVAGDFPKFSSALSKRNASRGLYLEHLRNRDRFLPAGYNVVWMNGQQVQSREMDAFALLQQMRRERGIVGNLRSLGFTGTEAVQVLSHPAIADSKSESSSQRYDYRDHVEGGRVIIWLNDIEKDNRYSTWPGDLPSVSRSISVI